MIKKINSSFFIFGAVFILNLGLGFLLVSHLSHTVFAAATLNDNNVAYEEQFVPGTEVSLNSTNTGDSGGCGCPTCCLLTN